MIVIILAAVIFLLVIYLYYRITTKQNPPTPSPMDELSRLKQLYINDELYYARIFVIEAAKTVDELESYIRDKSRSIPSYDSINRARADFAAIGRYTNRGFKMDLAINYSNLRRLIEKLKKIDEAELYPIVHGIMSDNSGREYCDNTINSMIHWHLPMPVLVP